jgi:hypothetical protein
MVTLLLWSLMLIDGFFPYGGQMHIQNLPDAVQFADLMRGRFLVSHIKKGMTRGRVEKMLGPPYSVFGFNGGYFHASYHGGISIEFHEGEVDTVGIYRLTVE